MRIFEFGAAEFTEPGTTPRFNGSLSEILGNGASAPETIISRERGFPADIWGLGCALVEMFTGQAGLFGDASATMFDKLAMMEKLCGGTVGLDQLRSTQGNASLEEATSPHAQEVIDKMKSLEVGGIHPMCS